MNGQAGMFFLISKESASRLFQLMRFEPGIS